MSLFFAALVNLAGVRKPFLVSATISMVALIVSAVLAVQTIGATPEEDASLSFSRYFAGPATGRERSPETVVLQKPFCDAPVFLVDNVGL